MKPKFVVIAVIVVLAMMFMFRTSMYTEGDCTSDNEEYQDGKRCYDAGGNINMSGPFCKKECTGTWK